MSSDAFEVPPLSRRKIRDVADRVRQSLRITTPYFPIVPVIEFALPQVLDGFFHDVVDQAEMAAEYGAGCHAMTFPDERVMLIRGDIYERARAGKGRDRLTLAHELGHLLLHAGRGGFARRITQATPPYRSSEWQANAFAGELLLSFRHITQCSDAYVAAEMFGVSDAAAETQWEAFRRDGIVR